MYDEAAAVRGWTDSRTKLAPLFEPIPSTLPSR
jgi:hypothetical protein